MGAKFLQLTAMDIPHPVLVTPPPLFLKSFDRLMGIEGGYVNDPKDPGGETKWGISKRSYPKLDIKNLTREEAKYIYLRDFWIRGRMDVFDPALVFQVFDFAVNSGIETAIRYLQWAAGVSDDGYVGPITLAAIKSKGVSDMIMLFTAERLDYWTRRSNWDVAGRGWVRRVAQDLRYGADDTPTKV